MPATNAKHDTPRRLLYTYRQTAAMLGVSDRTVFAWVKEGRLRATRIGRTERISDAAIAQFIHQHEQSDKQ